MLHWRYVALALSLAFICTAFSDSLLGQEPEEAGLPTTPPSVAKASDEGKNAIGGFKRPEGFAVRLFAAEPLVANPVAFCIDHRGRFYVCESFRQNNGVTDNRGHDQKWLDDDLAAQTVADRRKYHLKHLGDKASDYTKYDDRIRLVTDNDGDGVADEAKVFARGFNQLVDGTGAGVLARGSNVYFTCIPKLYLLNDQNDDGVSDARITLHDGYGVRVAFRGHDLHGLCLGPDGRLYFSIGDRGYHIEHEGKLHHDPGSGAVFRCELDGSKLEVFATGLRNPQELAFDDFGNLFTGDNNSDSGDRARWVYVMEGGDTGWRMAYQYLSDRGPFNREKIWHPYHPEQPAYIAPPIANFADGPSGLIYYPGVGLPESFRGRFLLCDFRGTAGKSGIRSFRVKPKGAFFEMSDAEQPFWNILATDLAMGPDGKLYISDWVDGWNGEGKGRIYQFASAESESELAKSTYALLRDGMGKRQAEQLVSLLAHPDQRVRMEAQFELANRRDAKALSAACGSEQQQLARLHGIWGLGQIARKNQADEATLKLARSQINELVHDEDAELRAQAARLLGELGESSAAASLLRRLRDDSDRVRYFAAISLGKLKANQAVQGLTELLEQNNGLDPALRHAGMMGLALAAQPEQLYALKSHPSVAVRRTVVVALRRQKSPLLAAFLEDANPLVVVEAARAIHDLPVPDALPQLAEMISRVGDDEALVRRVLNANYRIGGPQQAQKLALYAADQQASTAMRLEAVAMLASWKSPSNRDRVLGMWRPLESRDPAPASRAVEHNLPSLLAGAEELRVKVIEAATKLGVEGLAVRLKKVLANSKEPDSLRAQALTALLTLKDPDVERFAKIAVSSDSSRLRASGLSVLAKLKPEQTVPKLVHAIQKGELHERQSAAKDLGEVDSDLARHAIEQFLQAILSDELPLDTQLDVVEAAKKNKAAAHKKLLRKIKQKAGDEPAGKYRMALAGGDASKGQRIFYERTNVSCVRCHKIDGKGGEVGPDLSKIGLDKKRDYLLEAIVAPNKAIAKNFETVMIIDADGKPQTGILKEETDDHLLLMTAEGQLIKIAQDDIEARRNGKSAMPEDLLKNLSNRDLRDLVEFLATRKNQR